MCNWACKTEVQSADGSVSEGKAANLCYNTVCLYFKKKDRKKIKIFIIHERNKRKSLISGFFVQFQKETFF